MVHSSFWESMGNRDHSVDRVFGPYKPDSVPPTSNQPERSTWLTPSSIARAKIRFLPCRNGSSRLEVRFLALARHPSQGEVLPNQSPVTERNHQEAVLDTEIC